MLKKIKMDYKLKKLTILTFLLIILTSFVSAVELKNDLKGYWGFNENVYDSKGLNNGTDVGADIDNIDKKLGNASYDFVPANGDHITLPLAMNVSHGINSTKNTAISLWFKADNPGDAGGTTILGEYNAGTDNLRIITRSNTIKSRVFTNNEDTNEGFNINQAFADTGSWHHLVVSMGIINTSFWLDNSLVGSNSKYTMNWPLLELAIGRLSNADGKYFDGNIDEIAIFNKSCEKSCVNWLYNSGSARQYTDFSDLVTPSTNLTITITSFYSGNNVNNVSTIIDGNTYSNFTGNVIYTNISNNASLIKNIYIYHNLGEWFNKTVSHNLSTNLATTLKQSEINVFVQKHTGGIQVSNFSLVIGGTTYNTTGNNFSFFPDSNNYTASNLLDNTKNEVYSLSNNSFEVLILDNKSVTLTVFGHIINIFATNILKGTPITTFNVTIRGLNFTDERNNYTTNNISSFRVNDGSFNITIDAPNFANYNNSIIFNVNNSKEIWNYTFSLYSTNSVNITFYDSKTGGIIDDRNVTVEFIGATSQTNITDKGSLYIDLLNPSQYTLIYSASTYRQGSYIFNLEDRSFNIINLYFEKINDTSLVLITVKDKFSKDPVSNALITIQKYFNNSWNTQEIVKTDFNGQAEAWFEISTAFYNFLVESNGEVFFGVIDSNENKKVIYPEDVSNGITIEIDTEPDSTIPSYQSSYDVVSNIKFVRTNNLSGNFTFFFDDTDNIARFAQLNITLDGNINCSNSITIESSTLLCSVSVSNTSGINFFTARGYIDGNILETITISLGEDVAWNFNWGATGWIFSLFLVIIGFTMFLEIPSISLLIGSGVFVSLIFLGVFFSNVGIGILLMIMFIAFLFSRIPGKVSEGGT